MGACFSKCILLKRKKKSKWTNFLVTYRRHHAWSLPEPIIYYIAKNPSSAKCHEKMIQTCKYFFVQNSVLVISLLSLKLKNHEWHISLDHQKYINLNNLTNNIRFTDVLAIHNDIQTSHTALATIIPKIYQSDIKELELLRQDISFNDLVSLATKCEKIWFYEVTVRDENGFAVSLENVFGVLKNVKRFRWEFGNYAITTKTVPKLLSYSHFSNLDNFGLLNIPESFDIDTFYEYLKTNNKTKIWLSFCDDISEEYKIRLQTIVNELIIPDNCDDYKPPFIFFRGMNLLTFTLLRKLYIDNYIFSPTYPQEIS